MKFTVLPIALFLLVFTIYTSLILVLFRYIDPPTTAFIQQKDDELFVDIIETDSVSQEWMPIKSISNSIIFAVIASEDQRFIEHFGIDFVEVEKVIEKSFDGGKIRGASTITQQTAKNMFLFPEQLFIRKIAEAYYSVLMELLWSKKRILEVYLNVAQFGDNIFGVEAASQYYFDKPSQYLLVDEAIGLSAILPNPIKLNLNSKSNYLKRRISKIRQSINAIDKKGIVRKMDK